MFRNLPRFEYLNPRSLVDAVSLLDQHGPKAKVLAGGTDLIPQMRWGEIKPEYVLALSQIEDLYEIEYVSTTGLKLGALTKIGEIERSNICNEYYPILVQAASVLGATEIRNRATVGGNLCTAAPSADMAPALLALGARTIIATGKKERAVPLEEFFTGPKKTILKNNEILVRLEIPPVKPNSSGEYIKLGRRNAMEIALVSAAAQITLDGRKETCEEACLALGTAGPTPIRVKEAEGMLKGKKLDQKVIDLAAETASREASPRTSWRSTEEYRRDMIRVLIRRTIQGALDRINA